MATAEKIDLYKLHKDEYVTPKKPVLVHTKTASYLAIVGQGAPGGEVFTAKIGALYSVAFTVKMTRKFAGEQDYAVGKLEGQWFFNDGQEACLGPMNDWRWKLLIRTPEFVSQDEIRQAIEVLLRKGKPAEVKEVNRELACMARAWSLASPRKTRSACLEFRPAGPNSSGCSWKRFLPNYLRRPSKPGCCIPSRLLKRCAGS